VGRLQLIDATGRVSTFELEGETVEIGRSSQLDLTLADRSLSRRHARIFRDGERWIVEDLGSRNGTFVNQVQIHSPTEIRFGDRIVLGSCSLELLGEEGARGDSSSTSGQTMFRSATELLQQDLQGVDDIAERDEQTIQTLAERLRILNEVHQALDRSIELDELLELVLDRAFDHLKPEAGALYLRRVDGGVYRAASRTAPGKHAVGLDSSSLLGEVMEKGQAALVLDAENDQRFDQAASLLEAGVRSLLAAPLMDSGEAVGMIVVGSTLSLRQFSEDDMRLLTSLASVAAMRIRNVSLAEEAAERRQLEQEVRLARRIQVSLLPKEIFKPDGYAIHAGNIPSRGVSGDFYKVLERAGGRECAVLLADVSGKGIAASLLTASLEALSAAPIEDGLEPDAVFNRVSRLLFERTPSEKFATAFLVILDRETGGLRFVNAGHSPGIILRASGASNWLSSTGPPLGILPEASFTAGSESLLPGDTLVLYTDGITEAADPEDEEYGEERLLEVGLSNRNASLDELAEAIEKDVEAHAQGVPFTDDRTLVIMRRL
jgi:serine phosphatase RsbU (regulator of sigma subunit)